jgi:polysaccharide biosynthesis/export protein
MTRLGTPSLQSRRHSSCSAQAGSAISLLLLIQGPAWCQSIPQAASPGISPASPAPASPVPASPVPASPVPASPASASPAPASTASYRLGPGDQVDMTVFESPEFSGSKVIGPDGTLAVPLLGNIPAADRTVEQLTQDLQLRLKKLIKRPLVNLTVSQFRPLLVSVAGEVQRPGPQQLRSLPRDLRGGEVNNVGTTTLPTLSAALINAGGISRNADISQVILKRGTVSTTYNLWQGLTSENAPPDALLQDGDAIFVPKVTTGQFDQRLIARSTLAPKTIRVRVVGEVKKPGEQDVPPNSSISGAVAIAGGPTDKAKMNKVALVRLGADGKVDKQLLNLENLVDTQQVQDGDVVIVPKSKNFNLLDIAGQAVPPLGIILNLLK